MVKPKAKFVWRIMFEHIKQFWLQHGQNGNHTELCKHTELHILNVNGLAMFYNVIDIKLIQQDNKYKIYVLFILPEKYYFNCIEITIYFRKLS